MVFSTTQTKLEPIEIDSNAVVLSTTPVTGSIPHSNPLKRSRKSAHPAKTIIIPPESSFIDQITNNPLSIQIDEPLDDELSNLPPLNSIEEEQETALSDDETPATNSTHNSKRPRLTYNKRLEANARERERVHNLTAAFESLRQVIPMYGDQPKLSRLSILRIACSYVLVLGALNEIDFSEGQNAYTFNECFHMLSSTILSELKRKKTNHYQLNKND